MSHRQWPLPATYKLTSGFGPRWGTHHSGIDIGAPDGTPFYACADGTVQYIGPASGYGQWIVIDHPASVGGGCTEYGHMWNAYATGLKVGSKVTKGQLIGYVGSNGQSTGPHLHLTVWERGYGGRRIDPEQWLQGAPHPGAAQKPENTIFGIDISEHQKGLDLGKAAADGAQFAIIRTTDGTYRDHTYQQFVKAAGEAGLLTAAYHYLRAPKEGTTVAQQVRASVDVMGEHKRPVWIDVETEAGLHVNDIRECKREFEARGVHVIGCYSYVPYWENRIQPGEPDSHEFGAFWVAAYGKNNPGPPARIYPGNGHSQWDYPLGNQKPVLWQFGSRGLVGGYHLDVNAFRGTRKQLEQLFAGGGPSQKEGQSTMTQDSHELLRLTREVWQQLRGVGGKGWPQLGHNTQGQDLTLVDAVAALRHDVALLNQKVDRLQKGKP